MRSLFIMVALLCIVPAASGCDVCGCAIGANYFGILPQFHKHFVGMRWSEQSFRSAHSNSAARQGIYASDERFQTFDLIGRFYPSRRIQVLVMAPYHRFQRIENGKLLQNQGLGDVSLLGNYILLDSGDSLSRRWKHTLTLGGGVKLPSGAFEALDAEGEILHENLQTGSGSTDFMLNTAYTIRYGAWGISSDASLRLNTRNKNGYHFGNRVSGAAKVFYVKNIRRITLLPNIGVFADAAEASYEGRSKALGTGGVIALSTFGLDVYFGRFSLGSTFQSPLYQRMGEGRVQGGNRWLTTLTYSF